MQLGGGLQLCVAELVFPRCLPGAGERRGKLSVIWRSAETIQEFLTDDGSKRRITPASPKPKEQVDIPS